MDETRLAAIQALVEPILAERQLELVELTSRMHAGQTFVRLLVDAVGGVTIQQCARANQQIAQALEGSNLIEGRYTVEVSSPGLDRPLKSVRDFERALGEELELEVQGDDGRTKALDGMLLAVQPEAIVLKTGAGNLTLSLAQIRRAVKAIRW